MKKNSKSMAFPLTYRGKLEFPLRGNPDVVVEQYYEEASYKLSKGIPLEVDVSVSALGDKLIVSFSVEFKKILIIISALVLIAFGVYFSTWGFFMPQGLPRTWNRSGVTIPLACWEKVVVMFLSWLWLFGMIYTVAVMRLRSILKGTWKELKLQ